MSPPTLNNEDTQAFRALFLGYTEAYGTFEKTETEPQTGKKRGGHTTIHCPAPTQAWQGHLAGAPRSIGTNPLLDDGVSVNWAAIDIDVNDIDHAQLDSHIRELELPLLVCRSKSGGAHCYLFLVTPCPAKDVVDALANWAAALNYPGVEIFPKQIRREVDEKTGNPRPGNWINLPYFGGETIERHCMYRGERLSLGQFIDLAEGSRVGQETLKIRHIIAPHPGGPGPPNPARDATGSSILVGAAFGYAGPTRTKSEPLLWSLTKRRIPTITPTLHVGHSQTQRSIRSCPRY